jgi:hypothetical protein
MEELIEKVARARIGETFNFYRDGRGAATRRERLREYLGSRRDASFLLVGEAAGYRGARISGIPFTSERQLTGRGPAEATATIVHRVLAELGIEHDVLLWNVVPTHPGTETSDGWLMLFSATHTSVTPPTGEHTRSPWGSASAFGSRVTGASGHERWGRLWAPPAIARVTS